MSPVIVGEYTYSDGIEIRFPKTEHDLVIGKFCSIAQNLIVYLGGNHNTKFISTYPFFNKWGTPTANTECSKGPVIIGNDVWIGANVTILSGVRIGDGSVIGAFSVVTRDVDPYTIVAGNPAKFKKLRFNTAIIRDLLDIKWWDWPEDKIREASNLLSSNNVKGLIKFYNEKIKKD